MKPTKTTYRILSLLIALLMVFPLVVMSAHMLLHHHDNTSHLHDNTTICDKETTLCQYDNYTFNYFTLLPFKLKDKVVLFENFTKEERINKIYFNDVVSIYKGRAPPCFLKIQSDKKNKK